MVEFPSLASCVRLALLCGLLENASLNEIGSDKKMREKKILKFLEQPPSLKVLEREIFQHLLTL